MSSPARPLYIAKSIQELEKFSDIGSFHLENSKIPGLISKCFSDADSLFGSDDEKAYIYYDRGIKLYDKFCSGINTSEVRKLALKRSEAANVRISLRHDLKERYLEEQCKLLDALPVCTESFEAKNPEAAKEAAETKHYPGRWIPPDSLYAMLMTKKPLLFIDVRSRDEFEYRHIEYSSQINLGDKSRICKGVTITRIEKSLSNQERSNWDHLNSVKLIILVDEDTGEELIGHPEKAEYFDLPGRHPLKIVYDALVTYNANKDQIPPTIFLSGGIKEFLKRYPTFVTVSVDRKKSSAEGEKHRADPFVYPKLDDTNYIGDITLTEEDTQPIPPEIPVYPSITVKPYSELAKQLTDMSLGPPGNDQIYPVDSDRKARPKKKDSEKSSENISYPPPVDRSNKPKSDAPPVPPPPYDSLPDVPSNHAEARPTIDRSTKPSVSNKDLRATEPDSALTDSANDSVPRWPSTSSTNRFSRPPTSHVNRVLCTGLVNMGNTCYMNSTLQALLHNFDLREFFIAYDPHQRPPKKSGINRLFSQLVRQLCQGEQRAVEPTALRRGFGRLHSMFATSEQQDSHEFLMLLLDSLHEDLNRAKSTKMPPARSTSNANIDSKELAKESWERNRAVDDSEILDWFNGQLRSTVKCKTCQRSSHTFDEFMYLSVSVEATSMLELQSCIRQFFKTEALSGSSRWMCPGCKVPRDAIKTFDIWRLPKYLIIHLKRFQCSGACEKIESLVNFPLTELSLAHVTPQAPTASCSYDLYAVVNHSGTMQSGHYTAFCLDDTDKHWYKFDDSIVTQVAASSIVTRGAYVLFYKQRASGA